MGLRLVLSVLVLGWGRRGGRGMLLMSIIELVGMVDGDCRGDAGKGGRDEGVGVVSFVIA
jgi:hypothetical protein